MAYEGPEYWYVIYKAVGDFGDLMRDAAKAKAELQGMADSVKAETAAEVAGATQAAAARQKDIVAIREEAQALQQLANSAKQTNSQLLYGGRNDMTQHLADLAQELRYTELLNRQKWLGFSSVQQAVSYRQQMLQLALLENKAHFAGYLTADQYLGFLQRETAAATAQSAAIRARSAAISEETAALLAHDNAIHGTHQTLGQLGEGLSGATALTAAISGIPELVSTRAVFDSAGAMSDLAAYRAALVGIPRSETTDIISVATRLGGVSLGGARVPIQADIAPLANAEEAADALAAELAALNGTKIDTTAGFGDTGASGEIVKYTWALEHIPEKIQTEAEFEGPYVSLRTWMDQIMAAVREKYVFYAEMDDTEALDALNVLMDRLRVAYDESLRLQLGAGGGRGGGGGGGPPLALPPGAPEPNPNDPVAAAELTAELGRLTQAEKAVGDQANRTAQDWLNMAANADTATRAMAYVRAAALQNRLDNQAAAKAQDDVNTAVGAAIPLIAKAGTGWFGLNARLSLFAGVLGAGALGTVAAWHVILDVIIEAIAVLVPAITTLVAGLTAFGIAGYDAGKAVYDRITAIHTASDALNATIPPMTGNLEKLHQQVRPQVWQLYGDAIDVVHNKTGLFSNLALQTGNVIDRFAARITVDMTSAGSGLNTFFRVGGQDLAKLGNIFYNLGLALLQFIKVTQQTHIDQIFLNILDAASKMLLLITKLPVPLLAIGVGLHAVWLWGGLAATILAQVLGPMRGVVLALAGINAAEVTGGLAGLSKDASGFQRLKAILADISAGFAGLAGNIFGIGRATKQAAVEAEAAAGAITAADAAAGAAGAAGAGGAAAAGALGGTAAADAAAAAGAAVGADFVAAMTDPATIQKSLVEGGLPVVFESYFSKITELAKTFGDRIRGIFQTVADTASVVADDLAAMAAKVSQATSLTAADLANFAAQLGGDSAALRDVSTLSETGAALMTKYSQGLSDAAQGTLALAIRSGAGETEVAALAKTLSQATAQTKAMSDAAKVAQFVPLSAGDLAGLSQGMGDIQNLARSTTEGAALFEKYGSGLDQAGADMVALAIHAKATEQQVASLSSTLAKEGESAGAAAGGTSFFGNILSKLGPVFGNIYVDIALIAAAIIGVGIYFGLQADATRKWTDSLGAALAKASAFTVVSQTVSDLAAVTNELAYAQSHGVGNATELAAAQQDLSNKLGTELSHVSQVSKAYGTDFVGALELLNTAGVKTSDIFGAQGKAWAADMQMVDGLVQGYKAMGQGLSALQQDVSVQLVDTSSAVTSMQKLNSSWDQFQQMVSGPVNAFLTLDSSISTFIADASAAGAAMAGLGVDVLTAAGQTRQATPSVTNAAIALQQQFQTIYGNVGALFDAFRLSQAANGGQGDFTQFVKDAVAALIPLAGGNKAAAAEISQLAQEAGGPGTTSLAALAKWAGNVKSPMLALYNASEQATIGTANLSRDASILTTTLQQELQPAMAKAIFDAHGGQQVFESFSLALAKSGPNSKVTISAARAVATELLATAGSAGNAQAIFVGYMEAQGLSATQAKDLWHKAAASTAKDSAQAAGNVAQNMARMRDELAKGADVAAPQLGSPGLWGQIEHVFMAGWDGVFNWFSKSVPHAFELTWNSIVAWFTNSVPHAFGTVWNDTWRNVGAPVTRAFNSVKTFIASSFDTWWKTHGDAVKGVWNGAWEAMKGIALSIWDPIKSAATGFWHFMSGGGGGSFLKDIWTGFREAGKQAWQWIKVAAQDGLIAIREIFTIIGHIAQAAWDEILATFKILWDGAVAVVRTAWDLVVAIVSVFLDVISGHWHQAWVDMLAFFHQVWNNLRDFALQTWRIIESTALKLWATMFKPAWNYFNTQLLQPLEHFWTSTVPGWLGDIGNAFKRLWDGAWGNFKTTFLQPVEGWFTSTLPNIMWNALKGGVDRVISGINTVIGWINDVTSVVGIPKIPGVPKLAHGGSVPGTGDEDGTHIIAMGGEYMLRKPARMALQAEYGPGFLDYLNQADTWLGAGSRGNAASQRPSAFGRYAGGGGILSDIGNWLGSVGGDLASLAKGAWHGIAGAAADIAKYGEQAVFNAMWDLTAKPFQVGLEHMGTPGAMGAAWLQDIHNGVATVIDGKTKLAKANVAKYGGNPFGPSAAGPGGGAPAANAALARSMMPAWGSGAEWAAWNDLEMHEAGWDQFARNPGSGAYGIPQALPPTKMPFAAQAAGGSNPRAQIGWMIQYIQYLSGPPPYGDPINADYHEHAYNWYASGGPVLSAIEQSGANREAQVAMALGSWLLTKWNDRAKEPKFGEYGAFLTNLHRHRGFTVRDAADPVKSARLMAPYYAQGARSASPSVWKRSPEMAALQAATFAETAAGTVWDIPSFAVVDQGWKHVVDAMPAREGSSHHIPEGDVRAWSATAARFRPEWESTLWNWNRLFNFDRRPGPVPGVSGHAWDEWLTEKRAIDRDAMRSFGAMKPILRNLRRTPHKITNADWVGAETALQAWVEGMGKARLAQKSHPEEFYGVTHNLRWLESEFQTARKKHRYYPRIPEQWDTAVWNWDHLREWNRRPGGTAAPTKRAWEKWLVERAAAMRDAQLARVAMEPLIGNTTSPQMLNARNFTGAESALQRFAVSVSAAPLARQWHPEFWESTVKGSLGLETDIKAAAKAWEGIWGTYLIPGVSVRPPGQKPINVDLNKLIVGDPFGHGGTGAGDMGFAAGGVVPGLSNVAGMFAGGMAAGGMVPQLIVPGLSATLQKQLSSAGSGELPRTMSDAAAGSRVGLQVGNLTINNPRAERPSDSITRSSNRLAFMAGRGIV